MPERISLVALPPGRLFVAVGPFISRGAADVGTIRGPSKVKAEVAQVSGCRSLSLT